MKQSCPAASVLGSRSAVVLAMTGCVLLATERSLVVRGCGTSVGDGERAKLAMQD
jgi:hypothetical protein